MSRGVACYAPTGSSHKEPRSLFAALCLILFFAASFLILSFVAFSRAAATLQPQPLPDERRRPDQPDFPAELGAHNRRVLVVAGVHRVLTHGLVQRIE